MGRKKNNFPFDEDVLFILNLIERYGHKARVVGGAVRDFIAHREISDVDIATTAQPKEIVDICAREGLSTLLTSPEHGSIAIGLHNKFYEITTLRKDVKTFGRRAEVTFSQSFKIDSRRRDFTINALYMDKEGRIYDYHSGIEDIRAGNIRFIGSVENRISEDYLRILRYFRFTAAYGNYKCNTEYLNVIAKLKSNVKILSGERIIAELLKIFKIPDSHKIVPSMWEVLNELFSLKSNPIAICAELGIESLSELEKLAMLLKFSEATDLTNKYNFPRSVRDMIFLEPVDYTQVFSKLKQMKKEYRAFYAKFFVVNLYFHAHYSKANAQNLLQELLAFCHSKYANFKFNSNELKTYGLTNKELGLLMKATKEFWLNNNVSHYECEKFARKYIDEKHKKLP
ncbi:MAG: CCA tRNA nucleotidyltransferase [Holosporaceae bacterium]|jgi:tRNA nucleotidyltransferase/poly(A) polymerase|nr:CCA tRNA nucleotidyltransferase [Holosporaceae bacterium]